MVHLYLRPSADAITSAASGAEGAVSGLADAVTGLGGALTGGVDALADSVSGIGSSLTGGVGGVADTVTGSVGAVTEEAAEAVQVGTMGMTAQATLTMHTDAAMT